MTAALKKSSHATQEQVRPLDPLGPAHGFLGYAEQFGRYFTQPRPWEPFFNAALKGLNSLDDFCGSSWR